LTRALSGVGIGTSPKAFIEHGINTTIVELDPVVHDYATRYFELPTNHTAHLQDAVTYVQDTALASPASFDYIIHDVFTGGAEPTALFTLEFLSGLETLLKPDGVIAIVCIPSSKS
jgi:spermidine synthase